MFRPKHFRFGWRFSNVRKVTEKIGTKKKKGGGGVRIKDNKF